MDALHKRSKLSFLTCEQLHNVGKSTACWKMHPLQRNDPTHPPHSLFAHAPPSQNQSIWKFGTDESLTSKKKTYTTPGSLPRPCASGRRRMWLGSSHLCFFFKKKKRRGNCHAATHPSMAPQRNLHTSASHPHFFSTMMCTVFHQRQLAWRVRPALPPPAPPPAHGCWDWQILVTLFHALLGVPRACQRDVHCKLRASWQSPTTHDTFVNRPLQTQKNQCSSRTRMSSRVLWLHPTKQFLAATLSNPAKPTPPPWHRLRIDQRLHLSKDPCWQFLEKLVAPPAHTTWLSWQWRAPCVACWPAGSKPRRPLEVTLRVHCSARKRNVWINRELRDAFSNTRIEYWPEVKTTPHHWQRRCWEYGEVEDVVGVLTPVCREMAQVFHDLLVEPRLLLVAEVGRRGKGRRTGGRWRGKRRMSSRRDNNHMDDHGDGVKVRTRLELEPNASVMKMCKEQVYVRTLSCAVLRKRWSALWHCLRCH